MHILNQVQVNLIYNTNCNLFLFGHFDTIPACDRQTDRQTDGRIAVASTALASIAARCNKLSQRLVEVIQHLSIKDAIFVFLHLAR